MGALLESLIIEQSKFLDLQTYFSGNQEGSSIDLWVQWGQLPAEPECEPAGFQSMCSLAGWLGLGECTQFRRLPSLLFTAPPLYGLSFF